MSGSGRFAIVPARAVEDRRLGNAALRVLCCLGTYSDKDGWCWPSVKTLADRIGVKRQAVQQALRELAEIGYIETTAQHRNDGGDTANRYRLLFDRALFVLRNRAADEEASSVQAELAGEQAELAGGVQAGLGGGCKLGLAPIKNVPKERPYGRPPAAAASEEPSEEPSRTSKPSDPPAESLGKIVFGACLEFLVANGVKVDSARKLLGKWRKEYGEAEVIEAVRAAQRDAVSEPVAWIIAALKQRASRAAGAGRAAI